MSKVQVNLPAPDFTQDDVYGNPVQLSGFKSRKNIMLVFNRGFM